jgi:hypothetical protein
MRDKLTHLPRVICDENFFGRHIGVCAQTPTRIWHSRSISSNAPDSS